MTVTLLQQCDDHKMSLFQDLKLKRRKVDSSLKYSSFLPYRTSPDSAGDVFHEARSSDDYGRCDDDSVDVFDGGGHQEVSSSPQVFLGLGAAPRPTDDYCHGRMSMTPPRPDTSSHYLPSHSPDICPIGLNGLSIQPPLASSTYQGSSYSPVGDYKPLMSMPGSPQLYHNHQTDHKPIMGLGGAPSPSLYSSPHGRINGVKPEVICGNGSSSNSYGSMVPSPPTKAYTPKLKTPTVILGEAGGVKTMVWTSPPSQECSSSAMYSADTTDAAARAADGLLALGQERRGSPHSPSSTMSVSPSARSPIMTSRSPMTPTSRRSPYTPTPSSPCYSRPIPSPSHMDHQQPMYPNYPSPSGMDHSSKSHQAPLNMEKLWAGDRSQVPGDALNLTRNDTNPWSSSSGHNSSGVDSTLTPSGIEDEDDQPMICMICEDRATGLHYGIITCEGCKGFFKRTVQNKRVYTCVAEGKCEVNKAQRNRCQYCRFQKCLRQGMVLAAVREDRMPGGRNSGAVYNLYKVKYKKKKNAKSNGQMKPCLFSSNENNKISVMEPMMVCSNSSSSMSNISTSPLPPLPSSSPMGSPPLSSPLPPGIGSGNILKAALMSPSNNDMGNHLRYRSEGNVTSSRSISYSTAQNMIQILVNGDDFEDLATLRNLDELLDHKSDLATKLCQLVDSIGMKLVQWTRGLPFYREVPVEVHTQLLTSKWHELLVLTTSTYLALYGHNRMGSKTSDGTEAEFRQEMSNNLSTLQTCLTSMMGQPFTMDTLRQDMEAMVEKMTYVTLHMRRLRIKIEEYVCLKVIALLNHAKVEHKELEDIQERYISCLRYFCEANFPNQPRRVEDLLVILTDIQAAAGLLQDTKMFYVPFLICSTISR